MTGSILRGAAALALVGAMLPAHAHDHEAARSEVTQIVEQTDQEQAMMVAIADAQASFDTFWAAYQAKTPGTGRFAVQVMLKGGSDGMEQAWLTDVAKAGAGFTGVLGYPPEILTRTYTKGDMVSFSPMDVTDWGYAEGQRLRGHFTTRASLPTLSDIEAEQARSLLHDNPLPN